MCRLSGRARRPFRQGRRSSDPLGTSEKKSYQVQAGSPDPAGLTANSHETLPLTPSSGFWVAALLFRASSLQNREGQRDPAGSIQTRPCRHPPPLIHHQFPHQTLFTTAVVAALTEPALHLSLSQVSDHRQAASSFAPWVRVVCLGSSLRKGPSQVVDDVGCPPGPRGSGRHSPYPPTEF